MRVDFKTFQSDWTDFRQKLGERSFWEKRDAWFSGLGYAYFMLEADDAERRRAITMFTSISDEYARRSALMLMRSVENLLP